MVRHPKPTAVLALDAPRRHPRELDGILLAVVLLCCLGLVMAVSIQGPQLSGGALAAMKKQGAKLAVGLAVFLLGAMVPLRLVYRYALHLFVLGSGCVYLAVLLGRTSKGASRWIEFAGYQFQPVDLARLSLLVLLARVVAGAGDSIRSFRGFLGAAAPGAVLALGLLLQPDTGNAVLCVALAAVIGLIGGVSIRYYGLFGLLMVGVLAAAHSMYPHVQRRLIGFANVEPGSQVSQSLVAIGSGGITGQGLGSGWMKMGFVPEAHNDFVFAIVGEELGLLGTLMVVGLYGAILWCGMRLVLSCTDKFRRLLILGLVLAICMQASINLLVVTGMVPPKGIDLPFVSAGGTNLVFCLAAVGLIGNAARSDFRAEQWEG